MRRREGGGSEGVRRKGEINPRLAVCAATDLEKAVRRRHGHRFQIEEQPC